MTKRWHTAQDYCNDPAGYEAHRRTKPDTYQRELAAAQLALATLCDIVLGEDATDRSDEALIRAVRALKGWG